MRTTFGIGEDGDPQFTLQSAHEHAVCYGISSMDSNAMKSPNPHSGIYEAKTSRCLDLNGGNPSCNQGGGILVVVEKKPICYAIVKLKEDGNPHSGCHETDVSCTLDQNGGSPNCEQGGGTDRV